MNKKKNATIALDLGTTSFKCAIVTEDGVMPGTVISDSYGVVRRNSEITYPADKYFDMVLSLLRRSCSTALENGVSIGSIGISSQAQTYVAVYRSGEALQDAVVWLDGRAVSEAMGVASAINDFARHSGFNAPSGQMFLPKIIHLKNNQPRVHSSAWKFLLLNEYVIFKLTGEAYGDSSNQGMGGFFDISKREISKISLSLAGITEKHLPQIYPPSSFGKPLTDGISEMLGIDSVEVYSCGNDQSCASAGVGLSGKNEILCNFGTAMVVYSLKERPPAALLGNQIAGISSMGDYYFLLGFESECGNILEALHLDSYPGEEFSFMIRDALETGFPVPGIKDAVAEAYPDIPRIRALKGRYPRSAVCRALMEIYADIFEGILWRNIGKSLPGKVFASGGLSLSEDWLLFLEKRCSLRFARTGGCHPALQGVYKTINSKGCV